jgi:nitrogen fixation NifU-like protein
MAENEFYRRAMLEHVRRPSNTGRVESPDRRASAQNPLCGDELELTIRLEGERIDEIRVQVRACSFAVASSSMMSELVSGISLEEARARWRMFQELWEDASAALPPSLASLAPLLVARDDKYRSRRACVLLPWQALHECLAVSHTPPKPTSRAWGAEET